MQDQPLATEDGPEKSGQRFGGFTKLGEYQHLFLLGGNDFGEFAQARKFTALFRQPGTAACVGLRWHQALTSVLSGRSAITFLSVFRRRKI